MQVVGWGSNPMIEVSLDEVKEACLEILLYAVRLRRDYPAINNPPEVATWKHSISHSDFIGWLKISNSSTDYIKLINDDNTVSLHLSFNPANHAVVYYRKGKDPRVIIRSINTHDTGS